MNRAIRSLSIEQWAVASLLACAVLAAGAGWKMGGDEAIGRYLGGQVVLSALDQDVSALDAFFGSDAKGGRQ